MSAPAPPWTEALEADGEGGVLVRVAVRPRARRTGVDGIHDGAVKLRLKAPPVDGKANAELVRWLAQLLGLPRRRVRFRRGEASRRKTLQVEGVDLDAVVAGLTRAHAEGA